MFSYVLRDLVRNPRRTLACLLGVALGVGLFSGVLFFIDAAGATMTRRAIAPLALDMQRVLTRPLGESLRLEERVSPSTLRTGQKATITLVVTNSAATSAHEVVVTDELPGALAYVRGTTKLNGSTVRDVGGRSPLTQGGFAQTGLNIGSLPPHAAARLTYKARAKRDVRMGSIQLHGRVSSEEELTPIRANEPRHVPLAELESAIGRIPGVAAADGLAFVDLPGGSLRSDGSVLADPVRVFAFDRRYQVHHPSIRVVGGSFEAGSALLSAEAARSLGASTGAGVRLSLPAGRALALPVGGVVELSQAKPLFSSRKTSKLDDFLYVPNAIVVSPSAFQRRIIPAFRAVRSVLGTEIKSFPLLEVDVIVARAALDSDPATALAQTRAIARSIERIAPWQDELVDNISNTLDVARADARVGKRMFLFLGLPGVLLAGFLAAYAGAVLAGTQRRELANLRLRGAHRGHLLRMLVYRTGAFAGVASLLGTGLGFISAIAILGADSVFKAAARDLLSSGLLAAGIGMTVTAFALYVPARRSLSREVSRERAELAAPAQVAWRRWRLDLALLAAAGVAQAIAFATGAFDTSGGSVSAGRSVSLPSHLLLAPLVAWVGGILLAARVLLALGSRLPVPPRFGPAVSGTLVRSLRRRPWALGAGIVAVGLVVAFGTSLALFAASYDEAKAADSEFVVGSDLRVTPSPLSPPPDARSFADQLRVRGISAVTPVVFRLENSVLIGRYNQRRTDLAAVDPGAFARIAPDPAAHAMAQLRADRRGLLVSAETADDLSIEPGDRVRVILARGTENEVQKTFRVRGFVTDVPGFPEGADLVADLAYYRLATRSRHADFFLAKSADGSEAGLARAVAALRSGPGRRHQLGIESTKTALDRDQSSLTALNVNGLVDLNSLYTLLAAVAGIAIFVFGLLLQRRREYVALRAYGMDARELQVLVFAEAAIVAVCGLAAGVCVGTGMAYLFVDVLRPLFVLDPGLSFPAGTIAAFAGLTIAATLGCALVATAALRRLRPTEILRET